MGRRGAVIVVSLGIVAFLSIIGTTCLIRSINESVLVQRSAARQQAFYLAEAGVDRAAMNLRTPTDATDDVTSLTLPAGQFQIDPLVSLGSNQWQVITRGISGSEQRRAEAVFQLTPQSVFQYALFGDSKVEIGGSAETDSYNSAAGAYGGANIAHHGDVGTNATVPGKVEVSGGGYFIDGQVVVGPNVTNPTTVMSDYRSAFITGGDSPPTDTHDVISRPSVFPMTSVSVPAGLTCNDSTLNGGTTTTLSPTGGALGNGSYCYRNLTVEGHATLTASGAVTIYITGQFIARGNSVIGVPTRPKNMLVLLNPLSSSSLESDLTGSTQFYGAMYGPQAEVDIQGHAEIYGSVIAKEVDITGSAEIHYDADLSTLSNPVVANTYQTRVVSWREL